MSKSKRYIGKIRRLRLRELCTKAGIGVVCYSDVHMRIFGPTVVDYWPTTGKGWMTGMTEKSRVMTPEEALDLALTERIEAVAVQHMEDLLLETEPAPWD